MVLFLSSPSATWTYIRNAHDKTRPNSPTSGPEDVRGFREEGTIGELEKSPLPNYLPFDVFLVGSSYV